MAAAPIHIVYCSSEDYLQYVAVSIKSLKENTPGNQVIHVITDSVSRKNWKRLLSEVKDCPNVEVEFHIADDQEIKSLKLGHWTKYAWYRILIPTILSDKINTALYLDVDTLVLGDVRPLFKIDMEGKSVAGCLGAENCLQETFRRCGYESCLKYICSGVLLMNLDYWRKECLKNSIIQWAENKGDELKYPDQDSINYVCRETKVILPMRYGVIGHYFSLDDFNRTYYKEELISCLVSPIIIHFANQNPWKIEIAQHPFQNEWNQYNKSLLHPSRRYYVTRGWNLVKMLLWKAIHRDDQKIPQKQDLLLSLKSL